MRLLWRGPLLDPSGYAEGGRAFVRGMDELGADLRVEALRWSPVESVQGHERARLARLSERPMPSPDVSVQHVFGRFVRPYVPGRVRAVRTMFETDRVPADWVGRLNQMDGVLVPTEHNRESFAAAGVDRGLLHVVPEPFELDGIDPHAAPMAIPEAHGTVVLAAFDWTLRKGWDVLLDAWCRAFAEHDDVTLVLKVWSTHGARSAEDLGAEVAAVLGRMGHDPERVPDIVILDRLLTRAEMSALYAACDVYCAPTRGEGWGRPITEAMAAGRPVIATGWSGPSAFVDESTGWAIPYRLVSVAEEAVREARHFAGHRWAEPDTDGLAAALRDAHERPGERAARGAAARERALLFDHRRVAGQALEVLGALTPRLADRHPRPGGGPMAVSLEGAVFAHHSLAAVNRDLVRAMARTGRARVALVDLEGRAPAAAERDALGPLTAWSEALLDRRPDVTVRHSFPPVLDPPGAGPLVAIMPWEFGSAPVEWVAAQRDGRVDEVWVPSEHTRRGYLRAGADPERVVVVPNGIDPERFRPAGPADAIGLPDDGRFRFLFVGGLVWRKGVDILLRAWEEAFRASDDVLLVVKDFGSGGPYARNVAHEWIRALQHDPQAAPVVHNSESLPEDAMPALYRSCDCLVQPYRGEGYCLPVAEAMACGLPAIIPEGGPTAEYAPPGTAITVATSPVVVPQLEVSGIVIPEPVTVAEVEAGALAAAMRAAYEEPDGARATGGRAAAWMHAHHTWDHAAAIALDRLERLTA